MHLRIKICGVTTPADAALAAALGADAVGLNFHPGSPRCVARSAVPAILRALPPFVEPVGVFVEQSPAAVADLLRDLAPVQIVQMHGRLSVETDYAPNRFLPAFAVRGPDDLSAIAAFLGALHARGRFPAAILVDGHAPGQHGGTGRTAPWELLASFRPSLPLVLAGGLTPDNVAEAVRAVGPYAVDVASGVESAPGKKDAGKVRAFIENARAAARELAP